MNLLDRIQQSRKVVGQLYPACKVEGGEAAVSREQHVGSEVRLPQSSR